jgi:predicted SprT family Zn-dependent metalloprotease
MKSFKSVSEVKDYANRLLDVEYDITVDGLTHHVNPTSIGYKFEWDNAKNRFGVCRYRRKVIGLSLPLVEGNLDNFYQINDTILHEIAHAISVHIHGVKGRGHGEFWKHVASSIGCNAKRCYSVKNMNMPQYKYTLICDNCGNESHARRMGSSEYSCGICSPRKFNKDFILRVIKNY